MDILKNDVTAIFGQIFDIKLEENKIHSRISTMTPGLDQKIDELEKNPVFLNDLAMIICLSKNKKSFLLEHQESDFRERNLQYILVL